jgi:hypothetical protein
MSDDDNMQVMETLDRLLNDPDVPMQPDLVWRLLDEVTEARERPGVASASVTVPPSLRQ